LEVTTIAGNVEAALPDGHTAQLSPVAAVETSDSLIVGARTARRQASEVPPSQKKPSTEKRTKLSLKPRSGR
jgi:hypothetical protein